MSQSKVTAEVIINRPLEEVFAFVRDMNNHAEWQTGVLESRVTSEGGVEVGSTYRYVTQMMGRQIQTEGQVITCDLDKGFFYRSTKAPFQIVGGYTFEKANGGTRLTQRIVADVEGFFRLAKPIVVRTTKRNLENNLLTLKDLLEALG
ncbi:MAG: SRPBCC family protein [Anaerolineales bacterium]